MSTRSCKPLAPSVGAEVVRGLRVRTPAATRSIDVVRRLRKRCSSPWPSDSIRSVENQMLGCFRNRYREVGRTDGAITGSNSSQAGRGRLKTPSTSATGIFMSTQHREQLPDRLSPAGDVMINTGTHFEAPAIKARFDAVSSGPLQVVTFTQGHPDHVGGWDWFDGADVETIAQANHPDVREYWRNLHPFLCPTDHEAVGRLHGRRGDSRGHAPEPVLTSSFIDSHRLRRRAGAGSSCTRPPAARPPMRSSVWMPEHRPPSSATSWVRSSATCPNLYTLQRRQDLRSAMAFIHSVDCVIALAAADACSTATRCSAERTRS